MTVQPTLTFPIETRMNRHGQARAFIAGTRVRVFDIYALAEIQGQTPDQIVDALPHLSLSQVHAALAYYFANREEVVRQFHEEVSVAKMHQQLTGPGPLHTKLAGKESADDSVSS